MTVQKIIYMGEFGHDPDEEGSLLLLSGFMKSKCSLAELVGVIANRAPAVMRARLAKGTLEALELADVPVIQGTECRQYRQTDDHLQFAADYLSDTQAFPKLDHFWKILREAKDQSIAIVCASGLTDMALLLARNTANSKERLALFKQKVCRVSIMGGVACEENSVLLDEDGRVMPAWDATNNQHDNIAEYVYTQLQRMEIELVIVSKYAAYAACVPRDIYTTFKNRGHPVGKRLERIQRSMIQNLWWRCCQPPESPARDGLPPELGPEWFSQAFCQGADLKSVSDMDDIWPYIRSFNFYDQMAVLAAIPALRDQYFDPILINEGLVQVIGLSRKYSPLKTKSDFC